MEGGQAELVTAMARGGAAGSDGTRRRPEREEMARPGTRVRVSRVELRAEQGERASGRGRRLYAQGGPGVEEQDGGTAAWRTWRQWCHCSPQ